MTTPSQHLHQQAAANTPSDMLHSQHGVAAHATATPGVEEHGLVVFVALTHGVQHGPAAEHMSEKPAGPARGAHDDTLPKRALIPCTRTNSGLSECQTPIASCPYSGLLAEETPIAPTQRPSASRKVRSAVRREDILEELHAAVRLREAPLPRRQKLQSLWD